MKDPYLYEDSSVLKNKANIKDEKQLRKVEGDITKYTLAIVYEQNFRKFNTETLINIHRIIFGDLYEWAGEFRTIQMAKPEPVLGGDTVRYLTPKQIKSELNEVSKEIAKLKKTDEKKQLMFKLVRITARIWQIHPFREGNTRTVVSFAVLLSKHLGMELNYSIFEKNAGYVRNSLVWASQGMYSNFEYLEKIFYNAAGITSDTKSAIKSQDNDYTMVGGYYVADYKETPHTYQDDNED